MSGHHRQRTPVVNTLPSFHQDLKPTNVLVMSGGASSHYDFKFKIADLGTAHFKEATSEGQLFDVATHGTLAYCKRRGDH